MTRRWDGEGEAVPLVKDQRLDYMQSHSQGATLPPTSLSGPAWGLL